MATAPFKPSNELTAIAVAYSQKNLIADLVLPRVSVNTKQFEYTKYNLADEFTVPQTLVGAKGQPNQIDWASTQVAASVNDHALDSPVTNDAIEQWEMASAAGLTKTLSPLARATRLTMGLVATRRELRAATLVFNANSYAAANKLTLSGTGMWSDYTNSDPHYEIMTKMDGMIQRPNVVVFGRNGFTKTSLNPKLKAVAFGSANAQRALTREMLAEILEVDQVIVGEGWLNIAAKGQAPNMVRIWGNSCAALNINADADTESGLTFGYTAQFGTQFAGTIEDADIGMRGGVRVRAGESVGEFVTANDLGYLWSNIVN